MRSWHLIAVSIVASASLLSAEMFADTRKINGERQTTDGSTVTTGASSGGDKINSGRDTGTSGAVQSSSRAGFKPAPAGYGLSNVQTWVAAHKAKNPTGFFYVYIDPSQIADREMTNNLRIAVGKAWNHLSWKPQLSIPEDISEGAGLAWALNGTEIWGNEATTNWGYIARCAAKRNIQISPAPVGACKTFPATDPVIASQFVFNAVNGGPYANIHKTPTDYASFSRKFRLGKIQYTSTHKEAIVCGPRITAYRPVDYNGQKLVYSFTSDEFTGRDKGNIQYRSSPTDSNQRQTGALRASPNDDSTAIASEWWMQLPNGFLYWGIHGEGSQERGKAEFPFAIDPANWKQNYDLANGRSCITCHATGIHAARSDDAYAGKNGWTSNDTLSTFYKVVGDKFRNNLQVLTDKMSDGDDAYAARIVGGTIEPISKAIMVVEGKYTGNGNAAACVKFCQGKYGPSRGQNFCSTLPAR